MKKSIFKLFFSLLVCTYVFSTVGVCVVSHYCGGSLEEISLFSKPNSCCGGEEEETDNCCKNDSQYISFQKDFTFYTLVSDCKVPIQQLFFLDNELTFHFSNNTTAHSLFIINEKNRPPNLVQNDIILSSVLRI